MRIGAIQLLIPGHIATMRFIFAVSGLNEVIWRCITLYCSTVRPKPAYIDFRQALSSHPRFTIATNTFAKLFLGAPHVAFF